MWKSTSELLASMAWDARNVISTQGFSMHPHRGFDILTYILDGSDGFRLCGNQPVRRVHPTILH